jgi:hypothetical protein
MWMVEALSVMMRRIPRLGFDAVKVVELTPVLHVVPFQEAIAPVMVPVYVFVVELGYPVVRNVVAI